MRWTKFVAMLLIAGSVVGCVEETVNTAVWTLIVQAIMDLIGNLPVA